MQAYHHDFLAMHCYAVLGECFIIALVLLGIKRPLALEEDDDEWWVTVVNPLQTSQSDKPSRA